MKIGIEILAGGRSNKDLTTAIIFENSSSTIVYSYISKPEYTPTGAIVRHRKGVIYSTQTKFPVGRTIDDYGHNTVIF